MTRSHERRQQQRSGAGRVSHVDGDVVEADLAGSLRSSVAAVASPAARAVPAASVARTQQAVGNAGIQRLLAVQRWDLSLLPTAGCNDVLDHIATRSPYKPEAAFTDAHFHFKPEVSVAADGGKHTATVSSANVDANITVDMPMWSPEGAMARPWAKAWRALRDHEATHEEVAERTRGTLKTEIEAISVTRPSAAAARSAAEAAANAKWRALLVAYRKEQAKLDPYVVDLTCP